MEYHAGQVRYSKPIELGPVADRVEADDGLEQATRRRDPSKRSQHSVVTCRDRS